MIAVRRCVVDTYIILSATRRGDRDKANEFIDQLSASDDRLSKLINELGGGKRNG